MSRTKLPTKVQLHIWLRAGGRCQYPGCNVPLWKDELTLAEMNRAYLAHIIADSPAGPRGDPLRSRQLSSDPANIMLLCDTHHRLIDREDVAGHSVQLLQQYKKEHEDRIEHQTAIQSDRRTHLVLFGTRIGDRHGLVNLEQACTAVLPERYPADRRGLRLDLAGNEVDESDPEFWALTTQYIERRLQRLLGEAHDQNGMPINHLSIFAIAPIPVLIYFGKQIGDIYASDVYQHQRSTSDWQWQGLQDAKFDYILERHGTRCKSTVAVNLSLSGFIHTTEISALLGNDVTIYTIRIPHPNRDFLRAKEQLELFRSNWLRLLADVRRDHGENCEIHLFPAIPCAVAVEIGRSLLPKSDPKIIVYDHDRERGGFHRTIVL